MSDKMNKAGLTRSQAKVIEALCEGKGFDEISAGIGVSKALMKRWLGQEAFRNELAFKIDLLKQQGHLILARCLPVAAARLANLMESENAETSRKACMDLVTLFAGEELKIKNEERLEEMNQETAATIVRALKAQRIRRERKETQCGVPSSECRNSEQ